MRSGISLSQFLRVFLHSLLIRPYSLAIIQNKIMFSVETIHIDIDK